MEQEIWKDITNYEDIYQVSNFGRVKSLKRSVKHSTGSYKILKERILKQAYRKNGYASVTLAKSGSKRNDNVHRLVAISFIRKPENKDWINHKDGNKYNAAASNLEWCTPSENELHKIHVLNIKPSIQNFKNVKQTDEVVRYNDKNIFGADLQFLLKRFISGEIISVKNLPRINKRRFYGKVNELRHRYHVPIVSRKNGTKYKEFLLIENFKINMSNIKPKGECRIWEIESGIKINERSISHGCKEWSL